MTVLTVTIDPVLGSVILAVIGGVFGAVKWWAKRQPPPYHPQEQIADLEKRYDAELAALRSEVATLRREVNEERDLRRATEDYAETLRQQISNGQGPPPAPWPKGVQS